MKTFRLVIIVFFVFGSFTMWAQTAEDITRIEFNTGSRTYREQAIFTKDSLVVIKEDFRKDKVPQVTKKKMNEKNWKALKDALQGVPVTDLATLKSTTDKRAYDAASHGTLILTANHAKSWTHTFDDETPHEKLQPVMKQILKMTGKGSPQRKEK